MATDRRNSVENEPELSNTMIARGLTPVKDNLLVILMDVAGLTQWGSSWSRERVCGRGAIRKNCGNLWKESKFHVSQSTKDGTSAVGSSVTSGCILATENKAL